MSDSKSFAIVSSYNEDNDNEYNKSQASSLRADIRS